VQQALQSSSYLHSIRQVMYSLIVCQCTAADQNLQPFTTNEAGPQQHKQSEIEKQKPLALVPSPAPSQCTSSIMHHSAQTVLAVHVTGNKPVAHCCMRATASGRPIATQPLGSGPLASLYAPHTPTLQSRTQCCFTQSGPTVITSNHSTPTACHVQCTA
jgi:hypothetical protein